MNQPRTKILLWGGILSVSVMALLALTFFVPEARAALLPRVNEALRKAHIVVNPTNQTAWAACVVAGKAQCKTFDVLVTTMTQYEKDYEAGKLDSPRPEVALTVQKVVQKLTEPIRKAQATVVSYNAPRPCSVSKQPGLLTVVLAGNKYLKFRVPCNIPRDLTIQVGSTAQIQYRGQGLIRDAVKIYRPFDTARGIVDSGDCPTCGSGTSSGSSSGGYGG